MYKMHSELTIESFNQTYDHRDMDKQNGFKRGWFQTFAPKCIGDPLGKQQVGLL